MGTGVRTESCYLLTRRGGKSLYLNDGRQEQEEVKTKENRRQAGKAIERYSFNKYLLNIYPLSGVVPGNTSMNKIGRILISVKLWSILFVN